MQNLTGDLMSKDVAKQAVGTYFELTEEIPEFSQCLSITIKHLGSFSSVAPLDSLPLGHPDHLHMGNGIHPRAKGEKKSWNQGSHEAQRAGMSSP